MLLLGELAVAAGGAATSLPWLLLLPLLLPLLPPLKISDLMLQLVVADVAPAPATAPATAPVTVPAPAVAPVAAAAPPVCSASICCACATHATHGHGPPNFFANMERSLRAGPSFMPSELTR